MNLLESLTLEHSKAQCDKIVKFVGKDRDRFKELVLVFLQGPYRITQRAAWPLSYCIQFHPELIQPHLKMILENLKKPHVHDAVKRNTVRLMQFISIPKSLQGLASRICFEFLQDPAEPVAVRVFSMTVLSRIAQEQPGLKNELKIIIEDQFPFGSAAFHSRAKKVLKQLN